MARPRERCVYLYIILVSFPSACASAWPVVVSLLVLKLVLKLSLQDTFGARRESTVSASDLDDIFSQIGMLLPCVCLLIRGPKGHSIGPESDITYGHASIQASGPNTPARSAAGSRLPMPPGTEQRMRSLRGDSPAVSEPVCSTFALIAYFRRPQPSRSGTLRRGEIVETPQRRRRRYQVTIVAGLLLVLALAIRAFYDKYVGPYCSPLPPLTHLILVCCCCTSNKMCPHSTHFRQLVGASAS
jgi:hypothetical protein